MKKYMVATELKEVLDCNGRDTGKLEKIAVFYSPEFGRRRYYRRDIRIPQEKLKLLDFKSENEAQKVCDIMNNISGIGFSVQSYIIPTIRKKYVYN